MTTFTMNDAENFAPAMLNADAIAGYIGGPYAAGAPWPDEAWKQCEGKGRLPIWVPRPNATAQDAESELFDIMKIAWHYGWPAGQLIAFDLETSLADVSYMEEMGPALRFFNNYGTVEYGSLSTISKYPPNLWKWSASWPDVGPGTPHIDPGMHATQWTSDVLAGVPYDQSLVTQAMFSRLLWR